MGPGLGGLAAGIAGIGSRGFPDNPEGLRGGLPGTGLGPSRSTGNVSSRGYATPGIGDRGGLSGSGGNQGDRGGGRRGIFPTSTATFKPLREYDRPEQGTVTRAADIHGVDESVSFLSDIGSAFTAIAPLGKAISAITNIFSDSTAAPTVVATPVESFGFEDSRAGYTVPQSRPIDFGFEDARAASQSTQNPSFFDELTENFGPITDFIGGIFDSSPGQPGLPTVPTGQGVVEANILAFPTSIVPVAGQVLAHGASTLMGYILGKATTNTGQRVSRKDIYNAAKHCGIPMAAATYGLSEGEVCQIVVKGLPRRRRGISAADLRRTRSTIRKITTMRKDLRVLAR